MQDLQLDCEAAKRRLGRMAKTSIRVHAFGHDHTTIVTQQDFKSITAHLLHATKLTTELALEDAGLTWDQISRIALVGGSTHMPSVRNMLKETSGMAPDVGVNPILAVSLGAAIYAHMLETGKKIETLRSVTEEDAGEPVIEVIEDDFPEVLPTATRARKKVPRGAPASDLLPEVRFVTAHGVGVKAMAFGEMKNTVLVPANTRVPTKVTKRFTATGSAAGGAFVRIEITQGDTDDCELAEILGIGRIDLPRHEPPGNPVDVTMEFDHQGRLHTHAVHVKSGQKMSVTVDVHGCLREDEVEDFREFMRTSGFIRPFTPEEAIARLDEFDDDDDEDLPIIEPI
jgi:molecular chaperone DnaK